MDNSFGQIVKESILRDQRPLCRRCAKPHVGECMAKDPVCYKCGKDGHYQRRCPIAAVGKSGLQGNNYFQNSTKMEVLTLEE